MIECYVDNNFGPWRKELFAQNFNTPKKYYLINTLDEVGLNKTNYESFTQMVIV